MKNCDLGLDITILEKRKMVAINPAIRPFWWFVNRKMDVRRPGMKTKKIVIKSTSGFCPVEYAYSDKLTITANSIAYEYKPYLKSDNSFNVYRKWSYKTTNSTLGLAFEKIAVAVDEILSRDQEAMYCDCGTIDFIVTYEDGNKVVREFGVPADEFAECFKIIREIIPVSEEIPEAIRISEDCDDEDE